MDQQDPSVRADDMEAMVPYWTKVKSIMGGVQSMLAESGTYLPQLADESDERYSLRKSLAKMTNVFHDVVENLAVRPFSEPTTIVDGTASSTLVEFSNDVNGRGVSLHSIAGAMLFDGIAYGVDWLLVDYTRGVPRNATKAQERELGARPYWVRYSALNVLAAETAMIGGKEQFTHVRLYEPITVRQGFEQVTYERVRVFDRQEVPGLIAGIPVAWGPPTVSLWEKRRDEEGKETWVEIMEPSVITIDTIPLIPFVTGRRKGTGWKIDPPMSSAAELQVNLFQQETGFEFAKAMTAFPMISGNGVAPALDNEGFPLPLDVGPGKALYAPPTGDSGGGSWTILEPSAESLRLLKDDIESTIKELRELGRQPLTANSGNLTRITTAVAAQKGNSAVLAWVLELQEALEKAMLLTAKWLNDSSEADVSINTEFDVSLEEDDGFKHVAEMRSAGEISREALIHEAKRRNLLDRDYDPLEDLEILLQEIEDAPDDEIEDDEDLDDDDADDDTEDDDEEDADDSDDE